MLNQFKSTINKALNGKSDWNNLTDDWCNGRFPINAHGSGGLWGAFITSRIFEMTRESLFVITPDEIEAQTLANNLKLFGDDQAVVFPWWGTMLYRGISPQAAVFGRRAAILSQLALGQRKIVICPLRSALGLLPPPEIIRETLLQIACEDEFHPDDILNHLVRIGYGRVPHVSVPGEFALRGEVLDVYPPGMDHAIRIVFAWDQVDEIRLFDPISQISIGKTEKVVLHPCKEVLWTDDLISRFKEIYTEKTCQNELKELQSHGVFRGEELFYPSLFDRPCTLTDYLNDGSATVFWDFGRLETHQMAMLKEYESLYREAEGQGFLITEPGNIVISLDELMDSQRRKIVFHTLKSREQKDVFHLACEPSRSFFGNIVYMKEELSALLLDGYKIFIFAESSSQQERISYLLKDIDGLQIGHAAITGGFVLPDAKILAIAESEIFGRRKSAPTSLSRVKTQAIETFIDLNTGDHVVHINYGVGLFKGIKRIKAGGNERDYIELEYFDEEIIFIPLEQVNLVQRYIGQEGRPPALDRIGSNSWSRKKERARKNVADIADRLIQLYARRNLASGFAYPADDDFQISFEAQFPWQETEDQLTAIREIKMDMESPKPMDRLLCGDVGFGKTEIAMRAAFKVVMGGRQVAYLCPTTILAEQHYENFIERFKRFPVKIALMSRFVPHSQMKSNIERISAGAIDIVIGTHRILSKDVVFKNLGFIIIDEEQRFGVRHKERFKELKTSLDCLSLSATPIPRTLHMSLVKIREMSLLRTPPNNRRPIETFVQQFDEELVADAIRRETERGGQVFYLHNRIESLEAVKMFLDKLVPEVFVEIAHGRMSAKELEDIMHRFVHGAFGVLISTTIIENGIDIPNVNTIIIDRADMYGISQLYQLRGRVGRSSRVAYAYLMYPENSQMSELSLKRLQIISDYSELGSGFKIAMKDLEVRGAGNLLGSEQTGDVAVVGFDLYLKLLDEAIREKSSNKDEEIEHETYLELDYSGYIPNSYISDESEKMDVYKKIAAVCDDAGLESVNAELHDRYGPLPEELHSLLSIAEIRIICSKLKITSLKERDGCLEVTFGKVSLISVEKVMRLISTSAGRVKFLPDKPDKLILITKRIGLKEKSVFIREKLEVLL